MSDKRIVIPVDGSEASVRALDVGVMLAQSMGAKVDVITVLDLLHVDPFEGYGMTDEEFERLQEKLKAETLDHVRDRLPQEGLDFTLRLLRGPVLKVLLEEGESEDVAFMVVGRTGKGFFERMVEGSVSRGLSTHCTRPVVVVP